MIANDGKWIVHGEGKMRSEKKRKCEEVKKERQALVYITRFIFNVLCIIDFVLMLRFDGLR